MERPGKEHMEPSEPGEENTAGRDPYDTDIIYKQHIYLSPGKQDCRQDGYGICQQCKPKRAVRGLEHVQKDMGDYVSVKSSDSLESYYKSQQEYQGLLERLNDKTIDKPGKILEKNIRMMSESYLDMTQDAVQAKRGRNVERYREAYERALTLYQYINTRISELNELQFKNNSASYQTMREALRYMEVFNMVILMIVMLAGLMVLRMLVKDMVTPLTSWPGPPIWWDRGTLTKDAGYGFQRRDWHCHQDLQPDGRKPGGICG